VVGRYKVVALVRSGVRMVEWCSCFDKGSVEGWMEGYVPHDGRKTIVLSVASICSLKKAEWKIHDGSSFWSA